MTRIGSLTLALLATSGITFAQGGWRRFGDLPLAPAAQQAPVAEAQDPTQPVDRSDSQAPNPAPNSPRVPPRYGLPPQLTINPGTFVSVRVDQMLSSNRNQPGDVFSSTLMQPVVVDGVVVAQRGQTVFFHDSDNPAFVDVLQELARLDAELAEARKKKEAAGAETNLPSPEAGAVSPPTP